MSKRSLIAKGLVALSLFSQHVTWAQAKVERPPQFVLLAFDGSYNNDVWQYSRDYTKAKKQQGIDVRFTFFINPSYLLTEDPKSNRNYHAPHKSKPGTSNIGWGDNNKDVGLRVDQMNEAYREGHEIASHTVGHYDGSNWSAAQWSSEFSQFDDILVNLFKYNNMGPTPMGYNRLLFDKRDIVGFRAPQLGHNSAMYSILPRFGITYDTSKTTTNEGYWPEKSSLGTWNFPLAQVKEPGGARRWVSMDYNFCVRDSARILSEDPGVMKLTYTRSNGKLAKNGDRACLNVISDAQKKKVKDNMMNIYRAYFNMNYYGNRAPLHIGHHFSSWMKGAYLDAFYQFADEVCGKPEVKCVTYKELQDYMEGKSRSELSALQAGNFNKMARPKSAILARHLDMMIKMAAKKDQLMFSLEGKDALMEGLKKFITVAGQTREFNGEMSLQDLRKMVKVGDEAIVRVAVKDRLDKEIATASFKIENVGTTQEKVGMKNIEEEWLKGDMEGAHKDDHHTHEGH